MSPLHISTHQGYGDCEDCGMYDWAHFTATFSDGFTLGGHRDGHLGGGNWGGDLLTVLLWSLQKLGYAVEIDGKPFEPMPYNVREAGGSWSTPQLLPPAHEVLKLITESQADPEDPEYVFVTSVQFPSLDMRSPLILTYAPPDAQGENAGWDGDWTSVIRQLLAQRVELVVEETSDEGSDDDSDED